MNSSLRTSILVILGILIGGIASHAFAQSTTKPGTMEMKAFVEPAYKLAMTINDHEALLKALKRAGDKKRLVKIPVMIQRYNVDSQGWSRVYIGTSIEAPRPIEIQLDDTALGVSLLDRIFQYCQKGEWCKLWLVGYWEDVIEYYQPGTALQKNHWRRLSIRHVAGPQADGDAAVVYIAKH